MSPIVQATAPVIENVGLARQTYRIRLHSPELAERIRPGQFVMLRLPGRSDPLLARPFALYDTVVDAAGLPIAIDVVYLVVGKMTGLLATVRAGEAIEVWGPLGNGFPDFGALDHVGLVAGGIGQTPFLAHVRDLLGTRGYGGRPPRQSRHSACRSIMEFAPPISPRDWPTSALPALRFTWQATMAASATKAM